MNPFVTYKVSGIHGVIVCDDDHSFTVTDDLIEAVEISQTRDSISGLKFTLKDVVEINDDVVSEVTNKAKDFLVNIYGGLQPSIQSLNLEVDRIYDPKQQNTEYNILCDTICMVDSISIIQGYRIDTFKNLFGKKTSHSDADDIYVLLFNIMNIDNVVTRYLMQYEILLNLVAPNRLQKEITDFINKEYNPTKSFDKIGFHQTRKPGKTYDEDDITYYRNLLGHNDASEKITDEIISSYSKKLAEILYFALSRM